MNRINSTLRNIAVFITLVILALAVFWLVSRQIEPGSQTVAKVTAVVPTTDPPTPATVAPQSTTEPTLSPMVEPTHTPFTPEVVTGKVTLITPPPPPPTIGSGSLSNYKLEEPVRLAVNRKNQTIPAGWTSDSQNLFTYSLLNQGSLSSYNSPDIKNSIVTIVPVKQSVNVQILPVIDLSSFVSRNPDFPSEPIKQLGNTNTFVFRENINESQFRLWLSDFTGVKQRILVETDSSHFNVSADGYLVYLNQNQLHLVKPTLNQSSMPVIWTIDLDSFDIDTTAFFDIALSLGGERIALYDGLGHFYLVNASQSETETVSLPDNKAASDAAWSPDGKVLAYFVYDMSNDYRAYSLILQEVESRQAQIVSNNFPLTTLDALRFDEFKWSPTGNLLAAVASPYSQCEDCRDRFVLVSRDGHYASILEKMNFIGKLEWSPRGEQISYLCVHDAYQPAEICVSTISVNLSNFAKSEPGIVA